MAEVVKDKYGKELHVGDRVEAPFVGGKGHSGQIDAIIIDAEHAQREGISNPPKVVFTNEKGQREVHAPTALNRLDVAEEASVKTVPSGI